MKRLATFSFVFGLASAGSPALAEQTIDQVSMHAAKPQPVLMTEAQLDDVAAGQLQISESLVSVQIGDVTVLETVRVLNNSVNDNVVTIQIPVAANIAASVVALGGNAAALAQQRGRQF